MRCGRSPASRRDGELDDNAAAYDMRLRGAAVRMSGKPLGTETDWRERYEALAKETRETYASVYCMLTDPEKPYADLEERLAVAANELYWANQSLQARGIFDNSEVPRG